MKDRIVWVLLLVVIVEALIILEVLGLGHKPLVLYDYRVYNQLALNIVDEAVFSMDETGPFSPTTFRPPGYPVFIALVYAIGGRSTMAIGLAQFALLGLTGYLLYRIGRRFTGRAEAGAGALLCIVYPPLAFLAPLYVAEAATTCLAVVVILILLRLQSEGGRLWHYGLLGAAIGAATMMRPSFLMLIFPVAAALLFSAAAGQRRRLLPAVTIMLLSYGLLVAPWIVRNRLLTGQWINVHTGAGWTLYVSAQQYGGEISYRLLKPEWDVVVAEFIRRTEEAEAALPGAAAADLSLTARREVWRDRLYLRDALAKLKGIPLGQYIRSLPGRYLWLWSTADAAPWQTGLFHRFQQLLHVALMGLIVVGCWLARSRLRLQWPLWIVPIYLMALHTVFHVEARYTIQARPFLLIYAGIGLIGLWRLAQRRLMGGRTTAAAMQDA